MDRGKSGSFLHIVIIKIIAEMVESRNQMESAEEQADQIEASATIQEVAKSDEKDLSSQSEPIEDAAL